MYLVCLNRKGQGRLLMRGVNTLTVAALQMGAPGPALVYHDRAYKRV